MANGLEILIIVAVHRLSVLLVIATKVVIMFMIQAQQGCLNARISGQILLLYEILSVR